MQLLLAVLSITLLELFVFYCHVICHYTTYEQKHVYMMSHKTVLSYVKSNGR